MYTKRFAIASLMALLSVSAGAATPGFQFVRQINLPSASPNYARMTTAVSDSLGGVYYSNNSTNDNIWYMADPLTAAAPADIQLVAAGPGFGSGSYMGMSIDSNGTLFASGSDAGKSVLVKVTGTGPSGPWTPVTVTLPAAYATGTGFIRLGGCAVVGPNKIVAPAFNDGSLHFFTVSGSTATLDGTAAGPASFSGYAPSVKFENGKIYMSHGVVSTGHGGMYVFNSDGTAAGTGAPSQLVADTAGQSSTNATYLSISYSATDNALAINRGNNAAGKQGWAIYDASVAAPWTEYKFLNGSEAGAPGALGSADMAMGHTFFKKGANRYFIGSNEDAAGTPAVGKFFVYQIIPSAVADWSTY